MKHLGQYSIVMAVCLSALAGYVDALGFLKLGGYFVSFMSGNSTRFVVGLVEHDWYHSLLIGSILSVFVIGSVTGTFVSQLICKSNPQFAVLILVTILLLIAASAYEVGFSYVAILFMTMAMGAENTIFQREGDIAIGLTYMTGTLVKLGQRIAQTIMGGDRLAWLPYLLLWLGLISGGAAGVTCFHLWELHSLWLAVAWAALLTVIINTKILAFIR